MNPCLSINDRVRQHTFGVWKRSQTLVLENGAVLFRRTFS